MKLVARGLQGEYHDTRSVRIALSGFLEGMERRMDANDRSSGDRSGPKSSAELLLECRRRFKEVDAEARGLRTTIALTRQVSGELELSKLLENAMKAVVDLTGAERGYVVLKDEKGDLQVMVSHDYDVESVEENELSFSRSIVLHVINLGAPTLVTNAATDERFAEAASVKMMDLRAVMAAPIKNGDGSSSRTCTPSGATPSPPTTSPSSVSGASPAPRGPRGPRPRTSAVPGGRIESRADWRGECHSRTRRTRSISSTTSGTSST
jgi:hypothetical protein